jgi:DNA-binding NarL/FixJ family response regulator
MVRTETPHSSVFRTLVVDDSEPWRQQICSILQTRPELRVIAEAADGLVAVQTAKEVQPDLILLDIGLPTLNGIEVARRIRKVAPQSKILFVSQESSIDMAEDALALGALGYVVKTRAGRELLTAVEAVCQGRRFVAGLAGHVPAEVASKQAPKGLHSDEALVPIPETGD